MIEHDWQSYLNDDFLLYFAARIRSVTLTSVWGFVLALKCWRNLIFLSKRVDQNVLFKEFLWLKNAPLCYICWIAYSNQESPMLFLLTPFVHKQDGRHMQNIVNMRGVSLVASSPVRHDSPVQTPLDVHSYHPPWKAFADYALHHDVDPNAPHFQHLVNQVNDNYTSLKCTRDLKWDKKMPNSKDLLDKRKEKREERTARYARVLWEVTEWRSMFDSLEFTRFFSILSWLSKSRENQISWLKVNMIW